MNGGICSGRRVADQHGNAICCLRGGKDIVEAGHHCVGIDLGIANVLFRGNDANIDAMDLQSQGKRIFTGEYRQEPATVLENILFGVVVKTGKVEAVLRKG